MRPIPRSSSEPPAEIGATAQVAGGVPAMCDGVTQGQPGMDLSLFSRDVIAMATAVALSHNMFDAAVYLGICDKIVPGLLIGALTFGHLPGVFIPAGPMPSGLPNDEKSRVRQLYMEGKVGRPELLEAESQVLSFARHLHLLRHRQFQPDAHGDHGPAPAGRELRQSRHAAARCADPRGGQARAVAHRRGQRLHARSADIVDERAIVNGLVGLLATGGSTNHTLHLIAIAAAAGLQVTWQDMSDLSDVVPLLARVYPNGIADVNHFHAAGGMGFLIRELLDGGYLHEDVKTVWGKGLDGYTVEAKLIDDELVLRAGARSIRRPQGAGTGQSSLSRPPAGSRC